MTAMYKPAIQLIIININSVEFSRLSVISNQLLFRLYWERSQRM